MNVTISNHYLTATLKPKGAELTSLKKVDSDTEYIWKADPDVWGRHSPVLFPVVGRLKEDSYVFDGKAYSLGQHGFARNLDFSIEDQKADVVEFLLTENEDTLQSYPFHFNLKISYRLWKNVLYVAYTVNNTHDGQLYFSIGGHPGFTCPLNPGENRSDYYLEFEKPESAVSHILDKGNLTKRTKKVIDNKKIKLSDDIFDEDALIFKSLNSEKISLKHQSGTAVLHVHFPGFPYLGIWSMNQKSPYVCIEPWYGLADNQDHNGELTSKEGIQILEPGESFNCEFGIEIE